MNSIDGIALDLLYHDAAGQGFLGIIASMLCSFVLAQMIAWCYTRTYRGFSYSRSFVHAMILGALVANIMIGGIGNSLALGLGVIGALAIIRFRTQIRDPRDIIFIFACLAVGIASGAGAYAVAVVGAIGFVMVAGYLHWSPIATMRTYEGLVRFMTMGEELDTDAVDRILEECCSHHQVASMREAIQGDGVEYTYQVRLRDPSYQTTLVNRLNALPNLQDASILMHRSTVEI